MEDYIQNSKFKIQNSGTGLPAEIEEMSQKEAQQAIQKGLVFFELKREVAERLNLPQLVPIFQQDLDQELTKGQISPAAIAAGIEAFKVLKPENEDYDVFLARYYLLEGQRALETQPPDFFQAQKYFQQALDLDVGEFSAEAAYYLAIVVQGDDPDLAIELYRRSIELNSGAATPHFELARLLRERRDLSAALDEFMAAYKLEPDSPNLLNEIGDTHLMADDWDKARAAFGRAAELEPDYWPLPVKQGISDYQVQDYRAAIQHLRAGLEKAPDEMNDTGEQGLYIQGLFYLGRSYDETGDKVRARRLYQTVLEIAPDHPGALEALYS